MTIEFDAGHWALLAVIVMMLLKQAWTSWLVMKERDTLTNKMLAGQGTLDSYVTGKKKLDEPVQTEPTQEETEALLDKLYEEDTESVS